MTIHNYFVPLNWNSTVTFKDPVLEGSSITFHSDPINLVFDPSLNENDISPLFLLSAEGDTLMLININRCAKYVAFNCKKISAPRWTSDDLEVVPLHGVFKENRARIMVRVQRDCFEIFSDDTLIKTYQKRIFKDVKSARYNGNRLSPFPNPVLVELNILPTAKGFIKTSSGTKAIAAFVIDDLLYTYSFNINPSVPSFQCEDAVLIYTDVIHLTTTHTWHGKVGKSTVRMELDNGPVIVAPLAMPLDPASTADGAGTWTQT